MPNNCSTLIQRKQNILHKILRSNSDGKLQNAVAETTAELCIAGTRITSAYSPSSSHHLIGTATSASNARRTNLFASNRIQPSSNHFYDTHLPFIRDTNGHIERHRQTPEKSHSYSRPKTPITNASPKSTGRPPSTSISSIFNALAKRSTENITGTYEDYEEILNSNLAPPSRRSQRPYKANATKPTTLSQKQSGDSGIDIHFSTSSADANQQQQQRALAMSTRVRTNVPQIHIEVPLAQEPVAKERSSFGPLYQRRQNNSVKTHTKQKIDKYRRRSEEVTQATNGSTQTNNGLTTTVPIVVLPPTARPKPPPSSPTAAVHRVSSDGEMQARVDVLRLSMDTNLIQTDQQRQSQPHQHARHRVKSPYLYTNLHSTKPMTPISNPQTPPVRLRRNHGPTQSASSLNSSQHPHNNNNTSNGRLQPPPPPNSTKQSVTPSAGNLYLAFIASRHLSTLEDALFECDIDHQKLLRIFTWLKGVEDHRYEQSNHEQLLIEQNQRMLDQEENLSLYSEIQHAVDDLPPNTTGKPCERIVTMHFED